MWLTRLSLQVLPFSVLGLVASILGAWLWPPSGSPGGTILRALILLLSFVGLVALKKTATWNIVLLAIFGALIGSFAGLLETGSKLQPWWLSLAMTLIILTISLLVGRAWRGRWNDIGVGLWVLTWIYLLGWAGLWLVHLDPLFQGVWAGFGLVLFGGMSAVWFSNSEQDLERLPGSTLGIDLYLLTLNIILAARILLLNIGS